jgi:hypothetical protein
MALQTDLLDALHQHLKTLGRPVPRWEVVAPSTLRIHQTDYDTWDVPLDPITQTLEQLPADARAARLSDAVRLLTAFVEAPPGELGFEVDWYNQASLNPRHLKRQAKRLVELPVAASHQAVISRHLVILVDEPKQRWFEQVLGMKEPLKRSDEELALAAAKWMSARVDSTALGAGARVVSGQYCEVALLFPEGAHELRGSPVALLTGGAQLFLAGSEDAEALERIAGAALAVVRSPGRPAVVDGVGLRHEGGVWMPWLPPREMTAARTAFLALLRQGKVEQYRFQAAALAGRNADYTFTAPEPLNGTEQTVATWAEGAPATLLPLADAYRLTPKDEGSVVFAGAALHRLVELGCVDPAGYLENQPVVPERFATVRFPTAVAREGLATFKADPLDCWWIELV